MFAFKIFVLTSAILNVGVSATQCGSDEVVELYCQEPTCSSHVDGGLSTVRPRLNSKQSLGIVGFNEHNFLVKSNKNEFSIVGKHTVKITKFANKKYWQHKVNIHKTNFEVCDSVSQSNGINPNDSNYAQTNINTDTTVSTDATSKTNDPVDTSKNINDASLYTKKDNEDNNNEINFDVPNNELDEDFDEVVKVESEDELDLNTNTLETMSSDAENLVNESFSVSSDQNFNLKPMSSDENDINDLTNQKNSPKPISPQQLENDSSTDCTLGSCVSDENTLPKEPKENIATKESNEYTKTTQQLPIVEEIDDSKKESMYNMPQNSDPLSLQNNNNFTGLQDTNFTEELNMESSHVPKSDNSQITQELSSLKNLNTSVNESINDVISQNPETTVNLQDAHNVRVSNTENVYQQQSSDIHFTQQLSDVKKVDDKMYESIDKTVSQNSDVESALINDDTKEVNIDRSHQQLNEAIPLVQDLPILEENSHLKELTNNIDLHVTDTVVDLKDNHEDIEKLNETVQHENMSIVPIQNTSDVINQQGNENDMPSLKEEKLEMKNERNIDNVLPNNTPLNNIEKQSHISNNMNTSEGYLPGSLNADLNNLSDVESITLMSNNGSVDGNTTHSTLTQNATENVLSTDHPTVDDVIETSEVLNKKLINQCTSENGCSNPLDLDSTPKYGYENIQQQFKPENKELTHENVLEPLDSNNNEKSNEFEPKNLVSSFGHPDACSGVSCLKFKRNVDKSVKYSQPVPKQVDQDLTSHSTNTEIEEENKKKINEITDQSDVELNLLDHFQNWLSSPTLNSLDFLWHIFGIDSSEPYDLYTDQPVDENQSMFKHMKYQNHSELYFIVAAVITLLFSLIYYKFQKGTYENHLLTLLAAKDQNLLIVEKELSILKEQSSGNTRTATERNSEIETLNDHLTKSEDIITSQAIRIEKLEQEIEELTENGMEMHKLLSSALESSAKNSEKFNVLKVKLVDSENLVAALTQKNFDKTKELEKKNGIIKTLQSSVDELTYKSNNLIEDNANISLQLEQVLTKNTLKESRLQSEINNLQFELDKQTNALFTAENEVSLSKDALQEVVSQKFNPAEAKKFLSSVKLSAELKSAKQMCDEYKLKLDESLKSNLQYLDHIDDLKNSIVNLENKILKLEEEKQESVNKLNILTKFFKEQEKEYLKQINEKALLCDNKEGESSDLVERIKSLNQEISNYKSEIQSLKKEITDQEASFKIQLSAADKKASDHWILYRQTERKFKEMELETAQLRNKMTMGDKKLENGAKSIDSSKDFEDELLDIPLPTVSPDFTLLSLLDFEPPPPILTNQRLPPLGALGQAPSPPVPLSRRHERSLSPSSPPPSQRSSVFRPLPQRYNYMNRQNSLGHSVESLDK